jgi:hypothetical protein
LPHCPRHFHEFDALFTKLSPLSVTVPGISIPQQRTFEVTAKWFVAKNRVKLLPRVCIFDTAANNSARFARPQPSGMVYQSKRDGQTGRTRIPLNSGDHRDSIS